MLIGITGQIGSGKSTFLSFLREAFCLDVIDADQIGHQVLELTDVKRQLVEHFGAGLVADHGRIDRTVLGRLAFQSAEQYAALNRIVWPELIAEIIRQLENRQSTDDLALDAAVLPDWPELAGRCSEIVVVTAAPEARRARLLQRGLGGDAISRIMQLQRPIAFYESIATVIVENTQSVHSLQEAAVRFAERVGLRRR